MGSQQETGDADMVNNMLATIKTNIFQLCHCIYNIEQQQTPKAVTKWQELLKNGHIRTLIKSPKTLTSDILICCTMSPANLSITLTNKSLLLSPVLQALV